MTVASVALFSGEVVQHFLYGLSARDPLALAAAVVLLFLAAAAAAALPARRAAQVEPAAALKGD